MNRIDLIETFGRNVTNETLNAAGFYKVREHGGTLIIATYYNPETNEEDAIVVRDYDYSDCCMDNDSLYNASIHKGAREAWLHANGFILPGDLVMVVKGRKVPKGTLHRVKGKREVKDRYGRWLCDYLVFEDGLATNEANCIRVIESAKTA